MAQSSNSVLLKTRKDDKCRGIKVLHKWLLEEWEEALPFDSIQINTGAQPSTEVSIISNNYADGHDILNVNRDDSSRFRLDAMTTNKHYATPAVVGEDVHTTYTDYNNEQIS